MKNDFLERSELEAMGFAHVGRHVLVSRHALFFSPERISIGDYSRIDAFSVLSAGSGGIHIGSHVHVSMQVSITGEAAVTLGDFASLSIQTIVLSSTEDLRDSALANPTVPMTMRHITSAPVLVDEYATVGARCLIMPGVTIGASAGVLATTFVRKDVPPFAIIGGSAGRVTRRRTAGHLAVAAALRRAEAGSG